MRELSPSEARDYLLSGGRDAIRVRGPLDLTDAPLETLPPGLSCYELDAARSQLVALPDDLQVRTRLTLDDCVRLASLPPGLTTGAISLRRCSSLHALPEGLSTWFLDLTGCQRFWRWPEQATVQNGNLILKDCLSLTRLPDWLTRLGQLDVAGCVELAQLPEGLKVSAWVDLGGTQITALPASLKGVGLRWRGAPIDERIAFRPDLITVEEALSERNAERRRVLIERIGYLEFAEKAEAQVLDADTDPGGSRRLLRIAIPDDEDLVGLACSCPSTGRHYLLRVPPDVTSCHQAAAWLAGFDDPSQYHPDIET